MLNACLLTFNVINIITIPCFQKKLGSFQIKDLSKSMMVSASSIIIIAYFLVNTNFLSALKETVSR